MFARPRSTIRRLKTVPGYSLPPLDVSPSIKETLRQHLQLHDEALVISEDEPSEDEISEGRSSPYGCLKHGASQENEPSMEDNHHNPDRYGINLDEPTWIQKGMTDSREPNERYTGNSKDSLCGTGNGRIQVPNGLSQGAGSHDGGDQPDKSAPGDGGGGGDGGGSDNRPSAFLTVPGTQHDDLISVFSFMTLDSSMTFSTMRKSFEEGRAWRRELAASMEQTNAHISEVARDDEQEQPASAEAHETTTTALNRVRRILHRSHDAAERATRRAERHEHRRERITRAEDWFRSVPKILKKLLWRRRRE